jgi:hypothetical protein
MNIRSFAAGAVIAFTATISASSVQALVVDYSGSNVNMGTVVAGQSGAITNNFSGFSFGGGVLGSNNAYGFLPTNTQITFSYSFSPATAGGNLMGYGSYDYIQSSVHYNGSSNSETSTGTTTVGYTNGIASSPLVFATANLSSLSGTTTITNLSSGIAQFQSLFYGLLSSTNGISSLTYNVSSVPLPAALPMFGALIASMFGFRHFRKQREGALAVAA